VVAWQYLTVAPSKTQVALPKIIKNSGGTSQNGGWHRQIAFSGWFSLQEGRWSGIDNQLKKVVGGFVASMSP